MQELELRDYLRILRKRRWLVVVCLLAFVGVAAALTVSATPIYQASAKLFVGQRQVTTEELQQGVQVSQLSQQLLATYAEVIRTTPIVEQAIEAANLDASSRSLSSQLEAAPIIDTQLLRVSYRHPNPKIAQLTVNAVARAFESEIRKIEGARASPTDEPAIKVSLVQPALLPATPVSPQPVRNVGLAFVLGLVVGVGLALLIEYLDTTIKHKEDVEDRLGLPVLASVPRIQTRREELYLEGDNQSAFAETFRKLRTALQLYGAQVTNRTILVTSPLSSEGKSTTAVNLAAVFAYTGSHTVLVEADLRRPKLHQHYTIRDMNGLTMALLQRIDLDHAIMPTNIPHLDCIPAGAIPPNPVELLGSGSMHAILEDLRGRYETIIIDAPPMLPVADATTIVPRVDAAVLVARVKLTRRDQLRDSAELIRKVGGNIVGVVLNAVPVDLSAGQYSYYYDSEVRKAQAGRKRRRRVGARR